MQDATIVFDLDGTLVDTAPDLVHATNHVIAESGLAPVAASVLRPWIGFGARRMIVEALATTGATRPEAEIDRLLAAFLAYYAANIARDSRPFPGAVAALDEFAERRARLAICTNKREALAVALLRALGLAGYFVAIAGRDTFPVSKPDPGHLLGTIALAGGEATRAVMVGDSSVDVATAKAAEVPIVGVTFGYADTPIVDLAPDAVIEDFSQLGDAAARLLDGVSRVHSNEVSTPR